MYEKNTRAVSETHGCAVNFFQMSESVPESILTKYVEIANASHPLIALRQLSEDWINLTLTLLFPEFCVSQECGDRAVIERVEEVHRLQTQLAFQVDADPISPQSLHENLLDIREALRQDAQAILDGDPAATTIEEVILAYPGFCAIAHYRVAHFLHLSGFKLVPRIITEKAHRETGIDIHPGAVIGNRFFIDHGTGVVIGETSVIGANVKIYQGVTLGALSISKEMAKTKRHPNVEDNVVIYANATILGGETVIGSGSIIGGNAWITASVPPGSFVKYNAK